MAQTEKVELHPAFSWDCIECGRENFERAVVVEKSPELMQEMREDHGIEDWETGEFVTSPDEVECIYCKTQFTTEEM